jgi:hypothetical protein
VKLTDLDPRYYVVGTNPHPVGITFDCPCCNGSDRAVRLAIALHLDGTNFDPDPDNPQQFASGEKVWTIAGGDSFADLSVTPSVDASNTGHWHGFITNGEIQIA